MDMMRENLSKKQRIVVKVGSSTITHEATGNINFAKLEKLVRLLTDLHNQGKEVVLVTSGAVAVGRKFIGMQERPKSLSEKQACAAIGQASLMTVYQKLFSEYHQPCAQILMTKFTILNDITRQNACNTFEQLFKMGVIPIVNENDTVSTDEMENLGIGENDTLAALVTAMIHGDLVILLSDIDGLYSDDPKKNPDAKKYETLAISEIVDKKLGVIDLTSAVLCLENKMPLLIFSLNEENGIVDAAMGTSNGTVITV
jgi:glutamate 5-kinase